MMERSNLEDDGKENFLNKREIKALEKENKMILRAETKRGFEDNKSTTRKYPRFRGELPLYIAVATDEELSI